MVEQNARRALAMSHRGYVLDGGQNRFEGPGRQLLHDPKVVDLYLGGPGTEVARPRRSVIQDEQRSADARFEPEQA